MTENIKETPFTIEFVLAKLNESGINDKLQLENLQDYEAVDVTNGSAFMSQIFKLSFNWKDNNNTFLKSVILKVPGIANSKKLSFEIERNENEKKADIETSSLFLENAHDKELLFYKLFPMFDVKLKLPKFYYGYEFRNYHNQGLIIMEDLTPTGVTIPMLPGFSDMQICSVIDELARFHAASWKNRDWLAELSVFREENDGFIKLVKTMANSLKMFKKEWFADLIDELLPYFTSKNYADSYYDVEKFGFPACAVHGDLWAPNILWERDLNGKADDNVLAIIDWQMIHPGNPGEDISRLLNLNTTSEYRRTNTQRLLKRYTNRLYELFDGNPPCTYEQIQNAYNKALLHTAMYSSFGVPIYLKMASVVGAKTSADHIAKQNELMDRMQKFYEDTLCEIRKQNNK